MIAAHVLFLLDVSQCWLVVALFPVVVSFLRFVEVPFPPVVALFLFVAVLIPFVEVPQPFATALVLNDDLHQGFLRLRRIILAWFWRKI